MYVVYDAKRNITHKVKVMTPVNIFNDKIAKQTLVT